MTNGNVMMLVSKAQLPKLNGRIRRMDSLMIESNIRFLSRMELIYACISKQVVYLTKKQPDIIPEQLKHYADPNDYNRIFYHQRNDDMEAIIQRLLTDSDCLLHLCGTDFEHVTEYKLFTRCLSDQTVVESEKRRMRTKQDGTMNSFALQNPSDPDATYRNKAGKQYGGYSANIEETVGKNGSVVTDYQYDKNTHTDSQFLQETLSAMEKSEEEIILVTDVGLPWTALVVTGTDILLWTNAIPCSWICFLPRQGKHTHWSRKRGRLCGRA